MAATPRYGDGVSSVDDVTASARQAILTQVRELVGSTDGETLKDLTMTVLALSRFGPAGVEAPLTAIVERALSLGQTADAENLRHIAEALTAIHEYRRGGTAPPGPTIQTR